MGGVPEEVTTVIKDSWECFSVWFFGGNGVLGLL